MNNCKHPDCLYRSRKYQTCDYALIMHRRRPCPAGECEGVYKPGVRDQRSVWFAYNIYDFSKPTNAERKD